jgi:uncharacterized protein YyaL (SSP411 family)
VHTNRLSEEKSPYLLQHAHNPVQWYPWGQEAFNKARSEDKPIFLSIGYSTCHWCHVMERESFESEDIASVLNQSFVAIKVDREERPDIDRIYMTFVQATSGGGGWPMSVWLTPELKPFFGGTYFPPDNRYGRHGFRSVLEQLAEAWRTDRARIVQSGDEVLNELKKQTEIGRGAAADETVLESAFYQFRRSYDSRLGGFGGAPKFPRSVAYNFLLRYFKHTGNDEAADMVFVTLREMAKGGMNDQLAGGFHRYSVDARWFVPHFEKMLYDQAQLAVSYLEAYQITHENEYAEVVKRILDYVLRDMTHPAGGFYSAEDADSVIDPAHPHEKGEGAFYVWSQQEIDATLGTPLAAWFSYRYGVERNGNVLEDPHQEFTGKNILFERRTLAETAKQFGVDEAAVKSELQSATEQLLVERAKRVRPHLDDKILTSWNGLMISAFAKAGVTLKQPQYLQAAQGAAAFIRTELYREGVLLRRYRDGHAAIPGFLDDYAYFVQGLLDLYEADFDPQHLELAETLTQKAMDLFEDKEAGGFFSTAGAADDLVMRIKEDYDGAEPSANSVMASNLLRLAQHTGGSKYRESADRLLQVFGARMAAQPSTMPQMLCALLQNIIPPKQVVLAGHLSAVALMNEVLHARFLPFHAVLYAGTGNRNPALAAMTGVEGAPATAYVCENFTCQLPVVSVDELDALVQ